MPLEIAARLGQQVALFLDYDGTLTPIVEDPSAAVLDNNAGCRDVLRRLSAVRPVAIVSGGRATAAASCSPTACTSPAARPRHPRAGGALDAPPAGGGGARHARAAARALDAKLNALPGYSTEDNVF